MNGTEVIVPSRMPGAQQALSRVNMNLKKKKKKDTFDRKTRIQWLT